MIRVVKSHIFLFAFLVLLAYVPLAYFIPQDDFYILMGSLTACAALMTAHAFWPALVTAMKMPRNEVDYVDFLTIGTVGVWIAIFMRIGYLTYVRYRYGPLFYDTLFLTFTQYVIFVSSICYLSARRVVRNHVPQSSAPRIYWTLGVGLALGAALCLTN